MSTRSHSIPKNLLLLLPLVLASAAGLPLLFAGSAALGLGQALFLLAGVICALILLEQSQGEISPHITLGGVLALLVTAVVGTGSQGMMRWIGVTGLQLHTSSLLVPMIVVAVARQLHSEPRWPVIASIAGAQIALALQPEPIGSSALAVSVIVGASMAGWKLWQLSVLLLISAAGCFIAWSQTVPLEPVPTVEGILQLLAAKHWLLPYAAVLLQILACAVPLLGLRQPGQRIPALMLTLAFAAVCLAPLVGHWPVPWVGYGAGPILGYCIGLGLLFEPSAE